MLLATIVSTPYKIVLVLHILAAIIGFGSVMLNGVYASEARKRPGPEGSGWAGAWVALARISLSEDQKRGPQEQAQVESERPTARISDVEVECLAESGVGTCFHLPESG